MKSLALVVVGWSSVVLAEPTKADALAVVDAWTKAQNAGDAAAYTALYAPKFVGIKRTSNGGSAKLTRAQWQADRKKMFKAKQEVAAEGAIVAIENDKVTVTLTQRYKSGSYADHGDKALVLATDKTGTLLITREEMLYSAPGWEDGQDNFDVREMVPPFYVQVRKEARELKPLEDCASVSYTLVITDSKKKKETFDIGGGFVSASARVEMLGTEATTDELMSFGGWCAGGGDYYKVIKNGDALVVRYKGEDEDIDHEHPNPPAEWETRMTVVLPAGAKVR